VLIAIEDTGCGIRADDTDRIFSKFFTTKAHGINGTGDLPLDH
jgi:signal transduction histidine kinase